MEFEAAAALFSILRSESNRGVVKAAAVAGTARKAANRPKEAGEAEEKTNSKADPIAGTEGDAKGDAGKSSQRGVAAVAPLPLSSLVAAAKSLRKLVSNAMVFENSKAAMKWEAQGRFGGSSAVRLVRYLARQCDK